MPDKKYTYRVKAGHRWGPFFQYGPGSVIELTEAEAEGFRDSLEFVKGAIPTKQAESVSTGPVKPANLEDEVPDPAEYLATLTTAQLKHLDEWSEVEPPKPTAKADIISAILEVRRAKA